MSASRTKEFFAAVVLCAAAPAFAQDPASSSDRDASFLAAPAPIAVPTFSGLAAPGLVPPPSSTTDSPPASTPPEKTTVTVPLTTTPPPAAAEPIPSPVPASEPTPAVVPTPAAPPALTPPPAATAAPAPVLSAAPPAPTAPASASIPLSGAPVSAAPQPPAPASAAPATPTPATATPIEPIPPVTPPTAKQLGLIAPVETVMLPNISSESIGVASAGNLPAGLWKGTPRLLAEKLIAIAQLTASPVLNNLTRRLLASPAVPPEGDEAGGPSLTALRVSKLIAFADTPTAWALAIHAETKSLDDDAFRSAAEYALAAKIDLCRRLPDFAMMRNDNDWQKAQILCQLRAGDGKAVEVTLDVMRAQNTMRDDMFIEVAQHNIIGGSRDLPHQLTPLTPAMLALLRFSDLPLPGELYGHPDFSLVPSLLQARAKQDVAQLGLAERAAQRGAIDSAALAAIYKQITFTPDELGAPLTASESGVRQHALLYQAALTEPNGHKRVSYAARFMQSAPASLVSNSGSLLAEMAKAGAPEDSFAAEALTLAQIDMLANHGEAALQWLKTAPHSALDMTTDSFRALWPQFVLAGLESADAFPADLAAWIDATYKADLSNDQHAAHDAAAATLLMLDANGFPIPATDWARVITPAQNEKHVAVSPALIDRLQAASAAGRIAETILLATSLAGDGDIPLQSAVTITRALRVAGFKAEAAAFARHTLARLLAPSGSGN